MDQGTKTIGEFLRDLSAMLKKRPLDWKLIDPSRGCKNAKKKQTTIQSSEVRELGRSRIEATVRRSVTVLGPQSLLVTESVLQ